MSKEGSPFRESTDEPRYTMPLRKLRRMAKEQADRSPYGSEVPRIGERADEFVEHTVGDGSVPPAEGRHVFRGSDEWQNHGPQPPEAETDETS